MMNRAGCARRRHPRAGWVGTPRVGRRVRPCTRRFGYAHRFSHHRHVRDVTVRVDGAVVAVVEVRLQHRVGQTHVHPGEQFGVLGRVCPPVGGHTLDARVHRFHGPDGLLGQLLAAVGRGGDECAGALQAAERVLAVGRVPVHPRQREGVQCLQQKRANSAEERRHRPVHRPDRVRRGEPTWGTGGFGYGCRDFGGAVRAPGQNLAHLSGQRREGLFNSHPSTVAGVLCPRNRCGGD